MSRSVKRGESLYRAHDPFQSLSSVRTGSFKTIVMHRDGQAQVTGFQIAGERVPAFDLHQSPARGRA